MDFKTEHTAPILAFTVNRKVLLDRLSNVMRAISNQVTIPILTGIQLKATERGLTLTGSDSNITIETFIPIEENGELLLTVEQEGAIVLEAKFFNEIIRKLPTDNVSIFVTNNLQTTIRSGQSEFQLIGSNASDYPILPELEDTQSFDIPGQLLQSIIKETVFAVSQQETRPVLTGVHWHIRNDALYCVATDSHRLARRIADIPNMPEQFNVVIPGKSLDELNKILTPQDETVSVTLTDQQVLFKTDHVSFYSRLLEGSYPDTSSLIPEQGETTVRVKGKALLQAIDRASLLAREHRNNIVHFATSEDALTITSNSPEVGRVEDVVQATSITGQQLDISFSAKYMMDALKAIDSEEVDILFTGPMRPFILTAADSDAVLQLILPVRTY